MKGKGEGKDIPFQLIVAIPFVLNVDLVFKEELNLIFKKIVKQM